ncbi:hypothetical protein NPIL_411571 [Nephila pilipes]|uniref:Uncharacterized protein n=1 Tax=Nephila pilipes TaxID=299642 RepID=A0A8X6JZT7_NEPPI|nr:hypothetical protein NPIL_411571 [Nephila pilipes]
MIITQRKFQHRGIPTKRLPEQAEKQMKINPEPPVLRNNTFPAQTCHSVQHFTTYLRPRQSKMPSDERTNEVCSDLNQIILVSVLRFTALREYGYYLQSQHGRGGNASAIFSESGESTAVFNQFLLYPCLFVTFKTVASLNACHSYND